LEDVPGEGSGYTASVKDQPLVEVYLTQSSFWVFGIFRVKVSTTAIPNEPSFWLAITYVMMDKGVVNV
jgi:hypothetical protein